MSAITWWVLVLATIVVYTAFARLVLRLFGVKRFTVLKSLMMIILAVLSVPVSIHFFGM
jgi:small neutral amino acid transporter SnatA (MarC family)